MPRNLMNMSTADITELLCDRVLTKTLTTLETRVIVKPTKKVCIVFQVRSVLILVGFSFCLVDYTTLGNRENSLMRHTAGRKTLVLVRTVHREIVITLTLTLYTQIWQNESLKWLDFGM